MIELSWEPVRAFRLERSLDGSGGIVETARRLGGVHAQVMSCAELALVARVDGLRVENVREALWQRRELMKTWAMRGTLHLLPADELALWAGALRTRSYLWRAAAWTRYFGISVEELESLVAAIGSSLDGDGRTREELSAAVGEIAGPRAQEQVASGWGTLLKPVAMEGGLVFGPNRGRNVAFVTPHEWIGPFEPLESQEAMSEVARRWLRAYGPGSHEDLARWWGISAGRARKALDPLRDELLEVGIEGAPAVALAEDAEALERARKIGAPDCWPVRSLRRRLLPARRAGGVGVQAASLPHGGLDLAGRHRRREAGGDLEARAAQGNDGDHRRAVRQAPAVRLRELSDDAERFARALGATPSVSVAP